MTEVAVSARSLEKRFGPVAALRGIDVDLRRGRALAVLGPNGAGKSTFLRIVAGLSLPTAGTLEIALGKLGSGKRERAALRRQVGFVGHATMLSPELSAKENLVFAARLYAVSDADERAERLLQEEGLGEFAGRRAGTFSRGMAQRLAIARALVHDPQLILLDEPFTGLDPTSSTRLSARMRTLVGEGRTLIVTTHDLGRASEFADEAIVITRGRIVHRAEAAGLERAALEASYAEAIGARA